MIWSEALRLEDSEKKHNTDTTVQIVQVSHSHSQPCRSMQHFVVAMLSLCRNGRLYDSPVQLRMTCSCEYLGCMYNRKGEHWLTRHTI